MSLICSYCGKSFATQFNLSRHLKNIHGSSSDSFSYANNASNYKCLEDGCDSSFTRNFGLIDHLQKRHKFKVVTEKIEFKTFEGFNTWKKDVELKECCNYVKPRGRKINSGGNEVVYYICNRSVNNKAAKQIKTDCKRLTKSQGSCKLDRNCVSQIKLVKLSNGKISVTRQKTHYGHTAQIQHLRICKEDRDIIASKLKSGLSTSRILDTNRNKIGAVLKRTDLLTKQDIANIKRSYKLDVSEGVTYNNYDEISVEVKVLENEVITDAGNKMDMKETINNELSALQSKLNTVDFCNINQECYTQILANLNDIKGLLSLPCETSIPLQSYQFTLPKAKNPATVNNMNIKKLTRFNSTKQSSNQRTKRIKKTSKEETVNVNKILAENSLIISLDSSNDHRYSFRCY